MRGRGRAGAGVVGALAVLLSGCIHFDGSKFGPWDGDHATFVIDGSTISVTQSGTITVSGTGTPLDYSGPLGCEGMYFDADYTDSTSLDFRYSAEGADMLIGSDLYHFDGPPSIGERSLFWQGEFPDRDIKVTVGCTLPGASPSEASSPEGTPNLGNSNASPAPSSSSS